MKIFFAGILCAAATALLAVSLRHHEGTNAPQANYAAQKWLLPRSATAAGDSRPYTGSSAIATSATIATPSPNWIINSHGFCCEGNLAAQGQSTYVLLPVLDVGNKILRSDNGGQTWTQKYPPVDVSFPFGIEGDLNAWGDDIVYFGTEVADGVCAHSDNRGESWTVVQIPVAFPANDQAWAYLGPFANMRPGAPLPTDEPYVLAGWYRIGSVALFSFDGGLTWPIQTPLAGDDGSGPVHIVCKQTAHAPTSPGDTRIADVNFINHKSGRHGTWGTDKKFYWTETSNGALGPPGNLYVCKSDNFGATWTGIVHPIASGPDSGNVVTYSGFDNRGTLFVLHGDKLYVSFNQGESFAFVHTLPRYGNGEAADGANEFFVASCGTIHIGLIEAGDSGNQNVWYLRGTGVDTATPTWDEELVDVVGSNRLDFMQIVLNGNNIPTISYTVPGGEVTTASRNAPLPMVGPDPCAPGPVSVVSRKVHGTAGQKDILLPLPPYTSTNHRGVECRTPGNTGTTGVDYKVVFTFPSNITNCGTAGTTGGTVVPGPAASQCTENLNGLADQQYTTISLNGVTDAAGSSGTVIGPQMGLLVGDVNANGLVNSTDTSQVQAQSGQPVTGDLGTGNYRKDVNANGLINSTDTSTVQSKSGHGLPTPP
jgi:Dockerin type I domain